MRATSRSGALARLGLATAVVMAFGLAVGGCPKKKPKYPTCGSDEDCREGEVCVDKKCVQCAKNADCDEGEQCIDNACVSSVSESQCISDDDCPPDKTCRDGACVPCESNDECGPGGKCNNGVCERASKCQVDTDCADDEDCIDGYCQKPWQSEAPDVGCEMETIYFDFDDSTIREDQRDSLMETSECMREAPDRGVYLEGHTDPSGTEEYNVALSERRARSVADYLARLGIDPARFHVIPKGETEPSGMGDDQDRRVEFEWK